MFKSVDKADAFIEVLQKYEKENQIFVHVTTKT